MWKPAERTKDVEHLLEPVIEVIRFGPLTEGHMINELCLECRKKQAMRRHRLESEWPDSDRQWRPIYVYVSIKMLSKHE